MVLCVMCCVVVCCFGVRDAYWVGMYECGVVVVGVLCCMCVCDCGGSGWCGVVVRLRMLMGVCVSAHAWCGALR